MENCLKVQYKGLGLVLKSGLYIHLMEYSLAIKNGSKEWKELKGAPLLKWEY